jgi:uncharacterized membrane protein YgcG
VSTGYPTNAAGARRTSEDSGHVRVLIGCDFGVALTAAILAYGWVSQSHPDWVAAFAALGIALFGLLVGLLASAMAVSLAIGVALVAMVVARKSWGVIRRARGLVVVAGVVFVVLAAWWAALAAAAGVASALPSLLPLGCAAYVGVLLYRDDPRPGRWADVFLAGAVGVGLAAAFRPGIVADDPAAFPLFIAIAWLSARLWRSMRDSDNRLVRGSADVATALLLGVTLDLVVVWVGNLVGLPALTVLRVSHLLNAIAAGNDPAWWYLAVPLLLLAACYVVLIRWGGRLADLGARAGRRRMARWARKLPGIAALRPRQALTAFDSSRRLMQFLHVGLLLVPLVGITAPALLGQAVLGPLRPRYVIAYDAEGKADAQALAYRQLTREVAAASPSQRAAMRESVEGITSTVNGGSGGAADAWFTAATPAVNLGEEEGAYLEYAGEGATGAERGPPSLAAASATAVAAQVEAEEGDADEAESYADKAGASAAAAIATLLSIAPGGGSAQILQEYLGGLAEDSPVADALAGLAGRLGGDATEPPDAEQALNPGPAEQAAASGEISPSGDNGSTGSGGGASTGNGGGGDDGGDDGGGDDGGGGDSGGADGD